MDKFKVLYYPTFEPPANWLRSFLLFFDQINTIVPSDAGFTLSVENSKILELMPDAFETISPHDEDIKFDPNHLKRLEKAFDEIARNSHKGKTDSIIFEFGPGGETRIAGHVFQHYTKTSEEVRELLEKYKLIKPELLDVSRALGLREGYDVVEEDASLLLLSHIADRIGSRKSITTVTDHTLDFTVNGLNALSIQTSTDAATALARSIINFEIPSDVLSVPPKRFKEIRDAYADLREPFQQMTIDLANLYRLNALMDEQVLQSRIVEIVQSFDKELHNLKSGQFGRKVRKWLPIGIGSLAALVGAALPAPTIAIPCAALSVMIQIIQGLSSQMRPETSRETTQRLLAKMQKEILSASEVTKLA